MGAESAGYGHAEEREVGDFNSTTFYLVNLINFTVPIKTGNMDCPEYSNSAAPEGFPFLNLLTTHSSGKKQNKTKHDQPAETPITVYN